MHIDRTKRSHYVETENEWKAVETYNNISYTQKPVITQYKSENNLAMHICSLQL